MQGSQRLLRVSQTGPDTTALRLGEAQTTHPGLQQFRIHPLARMSPLGACPSRKRRWPTSCAMTCPAVWPATSYVRRRGPDSAEEGIRHTALFPCGSHHPGWKFPRRHGVRQNGDHQIATHCVGLGFPGECDVACEGTAVHPDDVHTDRGVNVFGDLGGGSAYIRPYTGIVVDVRGSRSGDSVATSARVHTNRLRDTATVGTKRPRIAPIVPPGVRPSPGKRERTGETDNQRRIGGTRVGGSKMAHSRTTVRKDTVPLSAVQSGHEPASGVGAR